VVRAHVPVIRLLSTTLLIGGDIALVFSALMIALVLQGIKLVCPRSWLARRKCLLQKNICTDCFCPIL